ncbi:MAG TPA: MarR family transcriptional regulator [Acidimicrobiia bacterium]|nr:MarR family transcriptional regulator [Acidimicrobiia bacterium]
MLNDSESTELADSLRLAVGRLARRLRQGTPGQLTPSQLSVLATLGRHGPVSMSSLAELEAVAPASISGIVARLVEKGLVIRNPNPDDGRSSLVELSGRGREVLDKGREERTAMVARRLARLSPEERATLAAVIATLDRLGEDE